MKEGFNKARGRGALLSSGVKTSSVAIKAAAGIVHWITLSATAAAVVGLVDALSDGTTYVWKATLPSDGYGHFILDPPAEFATGIWLHVASGTVDVIVGYK